MARSSIPSRVLFTALVPLAVAAWRPAQAAEPALVAPPGDAAGGPRDVTLWAADGLRIDLFASGLPSAGPFAARDGLLYLADD
jgi:hypothetical protein